MYASCDAQLIIRQTSVTWGDRVLALCLKDVANSMCGAVQLEQQGPGPDYNEG